MSIALHHFVGTMYGKLEKKIKPSQLNHRKRAATPVIIKSASSSSE
jgi:hypothetical protein